MTNKQAPRPRGTTRTAPGTTPPAAPAATPRLRVGTGLMIGGGAVAALAVFLPWMTMADGTTRLGVATIPGVGSLVLAVAIVVIAVFILVRPNHPQARQAAWGSLVAAMGIGALALVGILLTKQEDGASATLGVFAAIAGGMIATLGVRGLLERR